MYVHGDCQGEGVGGALSDLTSRLAQKLGSDTVWLGVGTDNVRGRTSYEGDLILDMGEHSLMTGSHIHSGLAMARPLEQVSAFKQLLHSIRCLQRLRLPERAPSSPVSPNSAPYIYQIEFHGTLIVHWPPVYSKSQGIDIWLLSTTAVQQPQPCFRD